MYLHSDSSVFRLQQAGPCSSPSNSPQLTARKPSGRARSFRERRPHLSPTPSGGGSANSHRRRLRSRSTRNEGNGRAMRKLAFSPLLAFPSSTAAGVADETPSLCSKIEYCERVNRSASCCEPSSVMKRPSCADVELADWVSVPESGFCGQKRTPLFRTMSMNTIYNYGLGEVSALDSFDHQNKLVRLSPPQARSSNSSNSSHGVDCSSSLEMAAAMRPGGRYCVSAIDLDIQSCKQKHPYSSNRIYQNNLLSDQGGVSNVVPAPKPQFLRQLGLRSGDGISSSLPTMPSTRDTPSADSYAASWTSAAEPTEPTEPTETESQTLRPTLHYAAIVSAAQISNDGSPPTQSSHNISGRLARFTRRLVSSLAFGSQKQSALTARKGDEKATQQQLDLDAIKYADGATDFAEHHSPGSSGTVPEDQHQMQDVSSPEGQISPSCSPCFSPNAPMPKLLQLSPSPSPIDSNFEQPSKDGTKPSFDSSLATFVSGTASESRDMLSDTDGAVPDKSRNNHSGTRLQHVLPWMNAHNQHGHHNGRRVARPLSWNLGSRPYAFSPPKGQFDDKHAPATAKAPVHEARNMKPAGSVATRRNISLVLPATKLASSSASSFMPVAPPKRAVPQTGVVTALAAAIGTTTTTVSANESLSGTPDARMWTSPPEFTVASCSGVLLQRKQAANAHDMLCRLANMKNSSLAIETSAATDSPPVSLHADHMEEWGLFISRCLRRSNSSSNNNQAVPEASYSCDAGYSSLPPSPNTASAKVDATDDDLAAVVPNGSDMVLPTYWFSDLSDQELEAFHDLLAKGVPDQFRRQVWMECSGALELPPFSVSSPKTLDSSNDAGEDDWVLVSNQHREEIELDMLRTAEESHPLAHDEHCIACLRNILYTYASQNPDIGYCQGMNKIAFGLLAAGLDAEDSLALLRSLLDGGILPGDLFKPPMLSLQADQLVLEELVSRSLPDLAQHLNAKLEGAAPLAPITVSWFLTLFVDYLPEPMRLRVWDMLFANGYEAVFQACLAILKLSQPTLLQCASPTAVYSVLQDIRGMMEHVDVEDFVDLAFRQMHLCASAAHIDEIRKLVCQ